VVGDGQFSVTTAFVSIVLSMFMAGLGIGSVVAGTWIRRLTGKSFHGTARKVTSAPYDAITDYKE
jgi:hypothetical protein